MKASDTALGLKQNWKQFTLLVIINGFVGGMVGLERTIFPAFAEQEFGIASNTAILAFIIAFGISKAIANYYTGKLANRVGRKALLVIGWLLAIPVPIMLIYAQIWACVIVANVLLGISQGLTWSSTVVMKIDLSGEKNRGLAMGLNEFAGYFAVGLVAFLTGYIATRYGITPYPFYLGIGISLFGLTLSLIWVKDTRMHVNTEAKSNTSQSHENVFTATTFTDRTLSAVTQAGMVNNLNDGMIWGLLPVLLSSLAYKSVDIGVITALYPTVWGVGQLFTGKLSDHLPHKQMLFWGMLAQGIAILILPFTSDFSHLAMLAILLGIGTAIVYPTFLSAIARATTPHQRAESIGTFRLWRDLGYAIGAIISGITADMFGIHWAIILIGFITVLSAWVIQLRMPKSA